MSKTKLVSYIGIFSLLVAVSSACALADQDTIGESNQNVTITANSNGTMGVTFGTCAASSGNTTCVLSGEALNSSMTLMQYIMEETYAGTGASPVTTSPGKNGIFDLNMNGASAMISFNGGTLWQPIQYTAFADGDMNPLAYGTWGSEAQPFEFALQDIDVNNRCSIGATCSLDSLTPGGEIDSPISAGGFESAFAPEPASLGLFGIGLLAIAFVIRSRATNGV